MSIFLHHKKLCVSIPTTTFVKYTNKGKFTQLHKKKNIYIYIYMPQGKISDVNEVHKWSELLETLIQLLTSIVVLNSLA